MTLDVVNIEGEKTGRQVALPADVFGIEPNEHAVYLAVKSYLANQRQGTHKAKERGEVKGSTRKIKRQKGTGTARAGDIKNPLFRGGGRVFGPRPRKYTVKLNKKVKRLARFSAFSDKASAGKIVVIEDFAFEAPKTREYVGILGNLGLNNTRVLHLTSELESTLRLSSRNLQKAKVVRSQDAATYDILHADTLIIAESALEQLTAQTINN